MLRTIATALPLYSTAALLMGACVPASDLGASCSTDGDCLELCSRVGECITAESSIDVRLRWSFNGSAPSPSNPSPCGEIGDFTVRFDSESRRDGPIAYYPVPCENGTVFYDKMPGRLVEVHLIGADESGQVTVSERREIVERSSLFEIDFSR